MQESQHSYFNFLHTDEFFPFAVNTQIHLLGLAARVFYRMTITFSSSTLQTMNTCAAPISRYNLRCDELMCDSPRKHVGSLRIHRNAREEQLRNPESVIGFLLQGPSRNSYTKLCVLQGRHVPKKY